jgi:hypothetical protein
MAMEATEALLMRPEPAPEQQPGLLGRLVAEPVSRPPQRPS